MDDEYISRAEVLNAIDTAFENGAFDGRYVYENLVDAITNLIHPLERISRPNSEWILASESLPMEQINVLVTYEDEHTGSRNVEVARLIYEKWCGDYDRFHPENTKVIAWMPMPKAYTADRETWKETTRILQEGEYHEQ